MEVTAFLSFKVLTFVLQISRIGVVGSDVESAVVVANKIFPGRVCMSAFSKMQSSLWCDATMESSPTCCMKKILVRSYVMTMHRTAHWLGPRFGWMVPEYAKAEHTQVDWKGNVRVYENRMNGKIIRFA